jgi:uncharacterized RDD family membrane protein YckC
VHVPVTPPAVEQIQVPQQFALPQVRPSYAGFWLRAVSFAIDQVIFAFIFGLTTSFRPDLFWIIPDPNTQNLSPATMQEFLKSIPHPTPDGLLLWFLLMWMYYAAFEASAWQATPGKKLLSLYVVDLSGRPITFARATIRHFAKVISNFTFLVGYIAAGLTEKKQALHDIIAGCLVLRRP